MALALLATRIFTPQFSILSAASNASPQELISSASIQKKDQPTHPTIFSFSSFSSQNYFYHWINSSPSLLISALREKCCSWIDSLISKRAYSFLDSFTSSTLFFVQVSFIFTCLDSKFSISLFEYILCPTGQTLLFASQYQTKQNIFTLIYANPRQLLQFYTQISEQWPLVEGCIGLRHNFIMYNSFICERRAKKQRQILQQKQKESQWLNRYHTQVQPVLLDHYGKRINSFIHNVAANPIVLGPQPLATVQPKGKSLVFKNCQDWKSLKGPCQRNLRTEQSLSNSSLNAQTKQDVRFYTPLRKVFRERSKQKQIHPPMRYNNKLNFQLAHIRKRQLHKLRPPIARERKMSDADPFFRPPTNLHSTNNSLSRYEDEEQFSRGIHNENIEVEARLYEKQREIVQKKLHFKKLLDLSLNNPDPQNRKEYKTILERCGIYRNKMREHKTDSGDFDRFASLVERAERPK